MKTLTLLKTGEKIDFMSMSFNIDLDSFAFTVGVALKNYVDFTKVSPPNSKYVECAVNVFGVNIVFIIESVPRGWSITESGRDENFRAKARSKAALLSAPHSALLSKHWINTTAKNIVLELCALKNITLDWQIDDWVIKSFFVDSQIPINIIISLVGTEGVMAIVQSSLDGGLIVLQRDKISPAKYDEYPMDYILSDTENLFVLDKDEEDREKYDSITIYPADSLIPSINEPTIELEDNDDSVTVKIFTVPFRKIYLTHSAPSFLNLIYEGEKTFEVTDEVVAKDGKGKLSKPFYELLATKWFTENLTITAITENGEVTFSEKITGLVDITYTSKYQRYRATASLIEKAVISTHELSNFLVIPLSHISKPANVSLGSENNVAEDVVLSLGIGEMAMRAHGIAVLRREMFDRKMINVGSFVSNELFLPASTVELREDKYGLVHKGIFTSLSFSITEKNVDVSYSVEAV